jgi:hypothetical protein
MRANGYMRTDSREGAEPLLRNAQLGRRTTPKKIRRRCGDYEKVGLEITQAWRDVACAESFNCSIDHECVSTSDSYLLRRKQELKRIVRVGTTEVGRAIESPIRI